jgi:hypothetical protein
MKQLMLAVMLAVGIGAALLVTSGISAVVGYADCLRVDNPDNPP